LCEHRPPTGLHLHQGPCRCSGSCDARYRRWHQTRVRRHTQAARRRIQAAMAANHQNGRRNKSQNRQDAVVSRSRVRTDTPVLIWEGHSAQKSLSFELWRATMTHRGAPTADRSSWKVCVGYMGAARSCRAARGNGSLEFGARVN